MNPSIIQLSAAQQRDINRLLEQFEQAWRDGIAPRIEDFIPSSFDPRGLLLEELVRIDLEYRWRESRRLSTAGPRIEEYVRRFPELGPLERLSPELIGEEYEVRQQWGDRPTHAEFLVRFPGQQAQVHNLLRQIDVRLAAEGVHGGGVPSVPFALEQCRPPNAVPLAQPVVTTMRLLEDLGHYRLLPADKLSEITHQGAERWPEPLALARELLQGGFLTPYQANQLLQGKGDSLMIGSYVLLERLGEGGTGQVFKGRHVKMNRLAALKLLRPELLADAEVVGRFYREIQVVSQLDHPNIVHAYDAGPAGATHFLAMEFVEGTDLGRLVKRGGPLPLQQACAYVRQAAMGLQHAHERNLVHRDVKPHNLIMSVHDGLIKLADLGLARLGRPANDQATAMLTGVRGSGTLTPENALLMGTLDYLAPEQALSFHAADIRADIYGLGCTFYYLLTGEPPFPGATLAEKLLKHQQASPPDLALRRADVPPAVAMVVHRMLAKRPEDRFQTPGEMAAALLAAEKGVLSEPVPARTEPAATIPADAVETMPAAKAPVVGSRRAPFRAWAVMSGLGLGAVILCGAVALLVVALRSGTQNPSARTPVAVGPRNTSRPTLTTGLARLPASGEYLLHVSGGVMTNDSGSGKIKPQMIESQPLGGKAMRVAFTPGDSVGVIRPQFNNWKPFTFLRFEIFNPANQPVQVTLTIQQNSLPDLARRIDWDLVLLPGKNAIKIRLADLKNGNGTVPDLTNVTHWYLADLEQKAPTLDFGNFWLER